MIKFRLIYGFLILLILFGGFTTAKALGLFPVSTKSGCSDYSQHDGDIDYSDVKGKGLDYPRGTYTIGEIIHAYNISHEEFYETLKLPPNTPETDTIIQLIKRGVITSKQVQAYMDPITKKFENK